MRKALLFLFPCLALGAYPEVDYFQRGTKEANWSTVGAATFNLPNSAINVSSTNARGFLAWVLGGLPGNDQFSETLADSAWAGRGSGARGGVAVRIDTSAATGYVCETGKSGTQYFLKLLKYNGTTETSITSNSPQTVTIAANDRLRLSVSGTSLTCDLFQGATGSTPRLAQATGTDATYSSGAAGYWGYTVNVAWSDWHGGTLGATEPLRAWICDPCYVSTTGTNQGTGTKADPLTLNWAMAKMATLGGRSVWVRGGTYTADDKRFFYDPGTDEAYFAFVFSGVSTSAYQNLRAYPGEKPIFDTAINCSSATQDNNVLALDGTFGIVHGVEVRNSGQGCKLTCGGHGAINGLVMLGEQVHFTGGIIRDIQQGVTSFTHDGASVRDTVIKHFTKRGGGGGLNWHGMYSHNVSANRWRVVNNFFLQQMWNSSGLYPSALCWQHYSQSGEDLSNTDAHGNIMALCGGLYMAGGGTPGILSSISFERNYLYKVSAQLQVDNVLIQNFDVKDNVFTGGLNVRYAGGVGSEFSGNVIACASCASTANLNVGFPNNASFDDFNEAWNVGFNNNQYFRSFSAAAAFGRTITGSSQVLSTLANWRLLTGTPDTSSTEDSTHYPSFGVAWPDAAATNAVQVSLSEDEPLRCHVAVYNWKDSTTGINLDLATCGYASGDEYEVIDPQNLAGGAIASGTYSGSTIDLGPHMSLTAIDTPFDAGYNQDPDTYCNPTVVGDPSPSFAHTTSQFGTRLIQRKQTFRTVNVGFYNPVASSASARLLSGPSASLLTYPPVTVACVQTATCAVIVDTHAAGKMSYKIEILNAGGTVIDSSDTRTESISSTFQGIVGDTFTLTAGSSAATFSTVGGGIQVPSTVGKGLFSSGVLVQ